VGEPGAAGGRALATAAFRIAAGRLTGAISSALTMRSGLGTGPWDTLFAALHGATGAGYGLLSAVAAVGLAGLAWAHGGRPRASMIGNAVAGGLLVGWVLPHVPRAGAGAGWAYAALALALGVLSGVLVLGTPHARTAYDGALVGVAARRGWGVGRTRLCLDVPALAAGWALGGRLGAGTVAGALLTGPLVQAALRVGAGGDLGAERAAPPRHARPPLAAPRLTPFEPARAIA
jgi:uncharacterized membrane protein YczE